MCTPKLARALPSALKPSSSVPLGSRRRTVNWLLVTQPTPLPLPSPSNPLTPSPPNHRPPSPPSANQAICPAYAIYFDHRRRSQPDFRRSLRREDRRQARIEKDLAHAESNLHLQQVKKLVDEARDEGFPTATEEKEQYFLEQVSMGETLSQDRKLLPPGRGGLSRF